MAQKPSTNASSNLGNLFGPETGVKSSSSLRLIPLERIERRSQVRQTFDDEDLQDLADNIRQFRDNGEGIEGTGILQPLTVTPLENDYFRLVMGERRFRAAKILGLERVPCTIQKETSSITLAQLTENIQRQDLNPLEQAKALHTLQNELGLSVRDLAEKVGKNRGWVENRLNLLKVPENVQHFALRHPNSLSQALLLGKIDDETKRQEWIQWVEEEGVSFTALKEKISQETPKEPVVEEAPEGVKEALETPQVSLRNDTSPPEKGEENAANISSSERLQLHLRRVEKQIEVLVADLAGLDEEERKGISPDVQALADRLAKACER